MVLYKSSNLLIMYVLVFLFLYSPPVFTFNVLFVTAPLALFYIMFNVNYFLSGYKWRSVLVLSAFFILFPIHLPIVAFFNHNNIIGSVGIYGILLLVFPCSLAFSIFMSKMDFDELKVLKFLLVIGAAQSFLAVFAFLFPEVQSFLIDGLTKTLPEGIAETYLLLKSVRLFGYASNLTFSVPAVQAFLAIVALFLSVVKKFSYVFYAPLLFFSAVINSRSALVIFSLGLVILFFNFFPNRVFRKKFVIIIFLSMMSISVVYLLTPSEYSNVTFEWITNGLREIFALLKGDISQGYFSYLFDGSKYVLPDGLSLIWGVGSRIMGLNKYGVSSDIGYVNDVWFGGLMYTVILYILFFFFSRSILKKKSNIKGLNHCLFFYFTFSLALLNFKGYVFSVNSFTTLFFIFFFHFGLRKA